MKLNVDFTDLENCAKQMGADPDASAFTIAHCEPAQEHTVHWDHEDHDYPCATSTEEHA